MIHPSRQSYEDGPPQPLVLSFPQAALNPFALFSRLSSIDGPTFLLESGHPRPEHPSYSFFGERPYGILLAQQDRTTLRERGRATVLTGDPLEELFQRTSSHPLPSRKDLPPFVGGAVGFLSYDYARAGAATRESLVPDLHFAFYDLVGAIEHHTHTVHLMFSPSAERIATEPRVRLYEEGCARLRDFHRRLTSSTPTTLPTYAWTRLTPSPGQSREAYMERVARCKDYIRAGDIYQTNLSHRFTFDLSPLQQVDGATHRSIGSALYGRLRQVNPSPFSAVMNFDESTIVSCSPERLVRLHGEQVETRPIAGTRPRGAGAWEDDRLKHELLANEKERAEHVMLVDLERNDLGRVCAYGSVQVDEFLTVEQYSHVSHLVSNVRGILRPDATRADLIRSVFPGGTITGVPKIRCMQIIDELEPVRRGLYTGSLGYVSRTGDMDWNILIRTMWLTGHRGYLQVGAGIVADSDPAREYEETLHKGQAFFSALRAQ